MTTSGIRPTVDTTHDIAAALRKRRRLLRSSLKASELGEPLLPHLRNQVISDSLDYRSRAVDELGTRMNTSADRQQNV